MISQHSCYVRVLSSAARAQIKVATGPLHRADGTPFPHTMEHTLRAHGLPTGLTRGVVELAHDHTVRDAGSMLLDVCHSSKLWLRKTSGFLYHRSQKKRKHVIAYGGAVTAAAAAKAKPKNKRKHVIAYGHAHMRPITLCAHGGAGMAVLTMKVVVDNGQASTTPGAVEACADCSMLQLAVGIQQTAGHATCCSAACIKCSHVPGEPHVPGERTYSTLQAGRVQRALLWHVIRGFLPMQVCTEGKTLTSHQAALLRHLGHKLSVFRLRLRAGLGPDGTLWESEAADSEDEGAEDGEAAAGFDDGLPSSMMLPEGFVQTAA
jgi:Insertion domain in 60S ribosomal protein L10P